MECWIYKSPKKDEMYVYLAKAEDFDCIPDALCQGFGDPEFVMNITLSSERTLAREDVTVVMNNLKSQGFHLQMPPAMGSDLYFGD